MLWKILGTSPHAWYQTRKREREGEGVKSLETAWEGFINDITQLGGWGSHFCDTINGSKSNYPFQCDRRG